MPTALGPRIQGPLSELQSGHRYLASVWGESRLLNKTSGPSVGMGLGQIIKWCNTCKKSVCILHAFLPWFFVCLFFCALGSIKLRAVHMLGKLSPTGLCFQLHLLYYKSSGHYLQCHIHCELSVDNYHTGFVRE